MKMRRTGFSTLEILIVLAIIGFFAAMIAPLLGRVSETEKADATDEQLDTLVRMVLGVDERVARDDETRLQQGYVADLSELPRLYRGAYDIATEAWTYTHAASDPGLAADPRYLEQDDTGYPYASPPLAYYADWDAFSTSANHAGETDFLLELLSLQPVSLFEREILPDGDDGDADDARVAAWDGPYANPPKDLYPDDAEYTNYVSGDDDRVALYLQRENAGRFADAWGRTILFWPRREGVSGSGNFELWILSAGPDGQVSFDLSGSEVDYDETDTENLDNLLRRITYNDWHGIVETQTAQTRSTLAGLRRALLGNPARRDRLNRPVVGGFVGDMGRLPAFFQYNTLTTSWSIRYTWDHDNDYWVRDVWNGTANFPERAGEPRVRPRGLRSARPLDAAAGERLHASGQRLRHRLGRGLRLRARTRRRGRGPRRRLGRSHLFPARARRQRPALDPQRRARPRGRFRRGALHHDRQHRRRERRQPPPLDRRRRVAQYRRHRARHLPHRRHGRGKHHQGAPLLRHRRLGLRRDRGPYLVRPLGGPVPRLLAHLR